MKFAARPQRRLPRRIKPTTKGVREAFLAGYEWGQLVPPPWTEAEIEAYYDSKSKRKL